MPHYTANKTDGEQHDIPDGERVVEQHTYNGVETLVTEEAEAFDCPHCGDTFYDEDARNGHMRIH